MISINIRCKIDDINVTNFLPGTHPLSSVLDHVGHAPCYSDIVKVLNNGKIYDATSNTPISSLHNGNGNETLILVFDRKSTKDIKNQSSNSSNAGSVNMGQVISSVSDAFVSNNNTSNISDVNKIFDKLLYCIKNYLYVKANNSIHISNAERDVEACIHDFNMIADNIKLDQESILMRKYNDIISSSYDKYTKYDKRVEALIVSGKERRDILGLPMPGTLPYSHKPSNPAKSTNNPSIELLESKVSTKEISIISPAIYEAAEKGNLTYETLQKLISNRLEKDVTVAVRDEKVMMNVSTPYALFNVTLALINGIMCNKYVYVFMI